MLHNTSISFCGKSQHVKSIYQKQQRRASLMVSHLIRRTRTQAGCHTVGEHRLIKTSFMNGTINADTATGRGMFPLGTQSQAKKCL